MPNNYVTGATANSVGKAKLETGLSELQKGQQEAAAAKFSGSSSTGGFNFQDINNAMGSIGGGGKIGDAIANIPEMFGANSAYGFSEDEKSTQSAIRKGLEMIPGYGQAIAAATGLVDAIGTATGLNLSSVDKSIADRAGITGTGFNKMMNMLPGNSMIWGGLSRAFGNNRTEKLNVSDDVLSMSSGYSGALKDINAAKDLGNKQLFF